MTFRERIETEYFEWLSDLVCGNRFSSNISYANLLRYLHDTEFRYLIPRDENRAADGMHLRYRYALSEGHPDLSEYISGPCSVLEMMIALAKHCEEGIMLDPSIGDRTGQWFWGMVKNLGLYTMTDDRFDIYYVDAVVQRFLNREYEPNGKGGLFTIENYERHGCDDLRKIEIFRQLCFYLDDYYI